MLSTRFDISLLCESRCRTQSPTTNIIIVLTRDFRTSHHILFTKTPETSSQDPFQTKQSSLFARPGTQSAGHGHEMTGSLAESERLSRLAKIRFAHTQLVLPGPAIAEARLSSPSERCDWGMAQTVKNRLKPSKTTRPAGRPLPDPRPKPSAVNPACRPPRWLAGLTAACRPNIERTSCAGDRGK